VYHLRAEFGRTVANAKRLQILDLLRNGRANVTRLARAMGVPLASVSQELAPLRRAGIVKTGREGKVVYYELASPKVLRACDLLAEAMRELQSARAVMAEDGKSWTEVLVPRPNVHGRREGAWKRTSGGTRLS
jgi:ArsR family transcriptional regulator